MRVAADLADWLAGDGAFLYESTLLQGAGPDVAGPEVRELVGHLRGQLQAAVAQEPPLWCDGAAVDLLAVMAGQVPLESLHGVPLLPRAGIVVLAHDLPTEWRGVTRVSPPHSDTQDPAAPAADRAESPAGDTRPDAREMDVRAPVRAITWQAWPTTRGDTLIIRGWTYRQPGLGRSEGRLVRMRELWPTQVVEIVSPAQDPVQAQPGYQLLHALAALIRAPFAAEERDTQPAMPSHKRGAARRAPSPGLRRLYLREPEMGRRELEELRAAGHTPGASPRGHWVRGHWRQQWYPSAEEHRLVWVEGYPRGDWQRGQVQGPAVLITRGDQPAE